MIKPTEPERGEPLRLLIVTRENEQDQAYGLGKTLTGGAVAEEVQRPLYSVGVGELGVTLTSLEENLESVLTLAHRWKAVLLLDEADVFLEERTEGDVERNAMVSTFLRLLEYYNGVLVLTSNRAESIDPAFYSRLSFVKHFKEQTPKVRTEIIKGLLTVMEVPLSDDDVRALSEERVNGRQLKNAIRMSKVVALTKGRTVTLKDIQMFIERMISFRDFFPKKSSV